ncbi:heme-binding protein [Mycobacterium sp. SMC-4]|uniref:heme-binding protein n=1 Tax=Mycobacterium sp. SMC-4 TaxID=2857059 RepID=UPI0021B345B4|nr:heme-binding protein [Mycobacterium sp. SMC-4]
MFDKTLTKRVLATAIGSGAVVIGLAAPAAAQPAAPNCTAGDFAKVMSGVTNAKGDYLLANPAVNDFFTSLKGTPKDEKKQAVTAYLDANPQVKADMDAIRQPVQDLKNQCGDTPAESE